MSQLAELLCSDPTTYLTHCVAILVTPDKDIRAVASIEKVYVTPNLIGHSVETCIRLLKRITINLNDSSISKQIIYEDEQQKVQTSLNYFLHLMEEQKDYYVWDDCLLKKDYKIQKYSDDGFIYIHLKNEDGQIYIMDEDNTEPYESDGLDAPLITHIGSKLLNINSDGKSKLQWAIINQVSQDEIIKMIDEFGNNCFPEHFDYNRNTALISACWYKLNDVAIKLIETFKEKCLPAQLSGLDECALYFAFQCCSKEVVQLMLDTYGKECVVGSMTGCEDGDGVSFDDWYKEYKKKQELDFIQNNRKGRSRLQQTIHDNTSEDEIIKMIDELGDNCFPEHTDNDHNTALHRACSMGFVKVAIKLIETVGDNCVPGQVNFNGDTALIWACFNGLDKLVIKLIETFKEKCLPAHRDRFDKSTIYFAFRNCSKEVVELMLDTYGKECVVGNFDDCKDEDGVSFDDWYKEYKKKQELDFIQKNQSSWSRLQQAIYNFTPDDEIIVMIDELGENCFPEHTGGYHGGTVLHTACSMGLVTVAIKLIETFKEKCLPAHLDRYNRSALYNAFRCCSKEIVELMLNTYGKECIVGNFDDCKDKDGVSFNDWYKKKQELDYIENNKDGRSRPHQAIIDEKSQDEIIKMIDELGENCFPANICKYGNTILMSACRCSYTKVAIKLIETLGNKCLPEHVSKNGSTALSLAFPFASDEVVIKLIETFKEKCLPTRSDKDYKNALFSAFNWRSKEVIKLMLDTYDMACVVGNMNGCKDRDGVLFNDWYKEYKESKEPKKPKPLNIVDCELPTISQCGQQLQQLVNNKQMDQAGKNIKINILLETMKCLATTSN